MEIRSDPIIRFFLWIVQSYLWGFIIWNKHPQGWKIWFKKCISIVYIVGNWHHILVLQCNFMEYEDLSVYWVKHENPLKIKFPSFSSLLHLKFLSREIRCDPSRLILWCYENYIQSVWHIALCKNFHLGWILSHEVMFCWDLITICLHTTQCLKGLLWNDIQ